MQSAIFVTTSAFNNGTPEPRSPHAALAKCGVQPTVPSRIPQSLHTGYGCYLTIRHGMIAREEAYLERKFGPTYRTYKSRVRRWL